VSERRDAAGGEGGMIPARREKLRDRGDFAAGTWTLSRGMFVVAAGKFTLSGGCGGAARREE
jgi:hypothetical protein